MRATCYILRAGFFFFFLITLTCLVHGGGGGGGTGIFTLLKSINSSSSQISAICRREYWAKECM